MIRSLTGRTWVHVVVGALSMGGWAMFANRMYATPEMLQAGVVQGVLAGFLTSVLKAVSDHLLTHLPHWTLAAGFTCILSAALLLKAHAMAGTPELLPTVAMPLLISATYVFVYSYLRGRDV